jgi:hypothetical protein
MRVWITIVMLWLCCLTATVEAAAFRHVRYEGDGDAAGPQYLDMHIPTRPGPNPVLIVYDGANGAGDAAPVEFGMLNAAGFVVARVSTRADDAAAVSDLASALTWLGRHVSSYGGDRDRMSLLAIGTAAPRAMRVLTQAPNESMHTLDARAINAPIDTLIVLDPQGVSAQRAEWQPRLAATGQFPRVLALYDATQAAARAQALQLTTQVAAHGWSAQALTWNDNPNATVAARSAQVAAWLASLEVPRVARYDAAMFATAPAWTEAPAQLLGADGVLLARGSAQAGQLLVLDAPDGVWRVERDVGALGMRVRWLGVLPRGETTRAVALLEDAGAYYLSVRHARTRTWSNPRRILDALPGASAPSVMAEPVTQQWQLVLDQQVLRLRDDARHDSWRTEAAPPLGLGTIVAASAGKNASYALVDSADAAVLYARAPRAQAWRAWARWPGARARALSIVRSGAAEYALAAFDGGRIARIDTQTPDSAQWDFDATLALRAYWGEGGSAIGVSMRHFEALTQPRTGERVHALALDVRAPPASSLAANAQWYLIRQADGSYAVGMVEADGAAPDVRLTQLVATPFAIDRGAALYAERAGAGVLRGALREHAPTHGLWRRRGHPEQGLVLEPLGEGWLVLLYSFDSDGAPAWYFAQGTLNNMQFVGDERGLARYVASWDETAAVRRDADRSGAIGIEFDAARCALEESASTRAAAVRLELGGVETQWCIDAVRTSGSDAPTLAANGVWFGGIGDQGWGLAIDAEGDVGAARERVLLFYHDAQGEPRWAAGEGARGAARSEQALWHLRGACLSCTERVRGAPRHAGSLRHDVAATCGVRDGRLDVQIDQFDGNTQFRRLGAGIQRLTAAACY